jgi:3-hydroxyisobutyrate dehydrogenase-like beta-hydroxyacid dehydrogenase
MIDASTPRRIVVIGLGKMGSALADVLLAGGFEVAVWNRTASKTERLLKAGATAAATVADAARNSDALVVCLSDYSALKAAVTTDDVGRALRRKSLIDLTSIRSDDVRALARWSQENAISLLKGTILAYPDDIRAGHCGVLYGGDKAAFERLAPVLQVMGGHPLHIGLGAEDGTNMARAYLCFLIPALAGFLHGAAVCHGLGMPLETYARSLVLSLVKGPAVGGMLERLTRASLTRRYNEDVQATLDVWNHALANIIHNLGSAHLHAGLLPAVKELLDGAAQRGFGEQDLGSVFEVLIAEDGVRSRQGGHSVA